MKENVLKNKAKQPKPEKLNSIQALIQIMSDLRHSNYGCPWDLEQDFQTIKPHTIEEAYEVADAIEKQDWQQLKDELGDLLFQVIYYAQLAKEENLFNFEDIVCSINQKMISRHPHIYGDTDISSSQEQSRLWENYKLDERKEKEQGLLDDVPHNLPALRKAEKLSKRAASIGFDWEKEEDIFKKIDEEIAEIKKASHEDKEIEIGDLLFVCVNLARHYGFSAEEALSKVNLKFKKRFSYMEKQANIQKKDLKNHSLHELEALWNKAKSQTG